MIPQLYYYNGIPVNPEGILFYSPLVSNSLCFVGNTLPIYYQQSFMKVNRDDLKNPILDNINQRPVRTKNKVSQSVTPPKKAQEQKIEKRIQNPLRNIFTNLTNLILNFVLSRKKVNNLLQNIDPSFVNEKLLAFQKYVKELKSYFCGYFNLERVHKLFVGTFLSTYNYQFHRMFRILAKIFLEQRIPLCIVTSKKLTRQLRSQHFKARRLMLVILKPIYFQQLRN